ncbi:MAG: hypothetical protein K8F91_18395 [Candidatus Obscuribacterales bacterium]|nr:hypothetical protein [Candidatus Obscuribacterales bacterium]
MRRPIETTYDNENQFARLEPGDVEESLKLLDELLEFLEQNLPGEGEPRGAAMSDPVNGQPNESGENQLGE